MPGSAPCTRRICKVHATSCSGSCAAGWAGLTYIQRFGHPRLRARHLPYAIGLSERDQWMACMMQAMQEQQLDEALAQRLAEAFFGTADWMRNKGG